MGGLASFARDGAATAAHTAARAAAATAHGVDWGQVALWAGIVGAVAAVIAIVPMTREAARGIWRALLMRTGMPYRRYARKFLKEYGSYENPYLGEYEQIDLLTTFVPLTFPTKDKQGYTVATQVLTGLAAGRRRGAESDQPGDRLIITGDPGSGKSTLLKAYGVLTLQGGRVTGRGARVVPYYVRLRELAKFISPDKGKGLTEFITSEMLKREGFFADAERGRAFFSRTVRERQAVVLLDGLDEVRDDSQVAVLGAVRSFLRDKSEDCPTERATILLTCRAQNFEMLRENWVPSFTRPGRVYTLAPLRDSEIVSYVQKFRHKFKTADGPDQFMKSIRGSEKTDTGRTIDLLRAPLVLAMSVGLYAHRPAQIPKTIAKLYQAMIEEMLERHRFLREAPDDSLLSYRMNDKYRLLRQFAFRAAEKSGTFGDFTKRELVAFSAKLAPSLEAVDDPAGLVEEIIRHSNLLTPQEHSDLYFFAHQSIQEFLAAQELQHRRDGDAFLLSRANDMNWRQAIQFYTAGREAQQVDDFITKLAALNAELAAHCLRAAGPSDDAARAVLDALKPITNARLNALASASRSPRQPVQRMAIDELKRYLADANGSITTAQAGIDGMLPLLESLAGTNAGEIAALVPGVLRHLPDDPRLVRPLWQCLSSDGIEMQKTQCSEIVLRLLTMVTELDSFAELERQDPHDREFLAACRARAYPFNEALPRDHNLVTLLAWAEYLHVLPATLNRFFHATAVGRLNGVEAARRRTVKLCLCWPARVVVTSLLLAALGFAITGLVTHPGWMLHPFGWWTLGLMFGTGVTPLVLVYVQTVEAYGMNVSWEQSGNPLLAIAKADIEDLLVDRSGLSLLAFIVVPAAFAIAPAALAGSSLTAYIALSICGQLLFWESDLELFESDRFYYPYRPNEFVDMYEDPKSRHWVARSKDAQPVPTLLAG
jgi:energy-coupling factor transporter ATP-binding protein EcfA2